MGRDADPDWCRETVIRLARVGHESVIGYILIHNYEGETKTVGQVPVEEVGEITTLKNGFQFIDVRRIAEHAGGHATRTLNIPLDKLATDFESLDPKAPTYVICQSGYRSSIGTGILENAGFISIYNVTGGTAAWIASGLPTES